MLIRSQDKLSITNLRATEHISIYNMSKYGSTFNISAGGSIIGRYSTEEKAIKVLDMIEEKYCTIQSLNCLTDGIGMELTSLDDAKIKAVVGMHRSTYVFQMPQDSEV